MKDFLEDGMNSQYFLKYFLDETKNGLGKEPVGEITLKPQESWSALTTGVSQGYRHHYIYKTGILNQAID